MLLKVFIPMGLSELEVLQVSFCRDQEYVALLLLMLSCSSVCQGSTAWSHGNGAAWLHMLQQMLLEASEPALNHSSC